VKINLNLAETLCANYQSGGLGFTAHLGQLAVQSQLCQCSPNTSPSIGGSKLVTHLLDGDHHANFLATVGHENEAEFLAVFKTVDDGLGTHLQAPLIKQYKYYMPKIDLLSTKKMLQLNNIHFLDFKEAIGILFYASQTIASGAIKISISPNYLAGEVVTVFHDQEKNFHFWLLFCYAMSIL
jgi:hypothetical protein